MEIIVILSLVALVVCAIYSMGYITGNFLGIFFNFNIGTPGSFIAAMIGTFISAAIFFLSSGYTWMNT